MLKYIVLKGLGFSANHDDDAAYYLPSASYHQLLVPHHLLSLFD